MGKNKRNQNYIRECNRINKVKIAIYSLTYNRAEYTEHCFKSLWRYAGHPYDHYIIDNGSQDTTVTWLKTNTDRFSDVVYLENNIGISKASNMALDMICKKDYDIVIKMDNDCEIVSPNILRQITEIYEYISKLPIEDIVSDQNGITIIRKSEKHPQYILSPNVGGLEFQPLRISSATLDGRNIGITAIIGGVFLVAPIAVYRMYRYPENLPLSSGQDTYFCNWGRDKGIQVGYIEDIFVNHYEGTQQKNRYPKYFHDR